MTLLPCNSINWQGARFEIRGKQYQKTAMSMASDENNCGTIFKAGTEILPIGEPLLLSAEEAEKWKPPTRPWTDFITPAPGETPTPVD